MQRTSGTFNYGFDDLAEPAPDYEVEPPPDYDDLDMSNEAADVNTFDSFTGVQNNADNANGSHPAEVQDYLTGHPYKGTPLTTELQIVREDYDANNETKVTKGKHKTKKDKKQSKKQARSNGIVSNVPDSNDLTHLGEQTPAVTHSGFPQLNAYPGYGIDGTSGASPSDLDRYSTQPPTTNNSDLGQHTFELHDKSDLPIGDVLTPAAVTAIATGVKGQTMPPKDKGKEAKKNKAKDDKSKKNDPTVQTGDEHDIEKGGSNSTDGKKTDSKEVHDNCCVRCCKCYGSFSKGCCKCWAKCCCKCSCCVCSGLCCSITIPLLVIAGIGVIVVLIFVYVV